MAERQTITRVAGADVCRSDPALLEREVHELVHVASDDHVRIDHDHAL